MANLDVDKLTHDTVKNGGILSILYFDLHAKDAGMLKDLSTGFVDTIIKTPGVVYAMGEINDPLESNGLYSTSIEVKVLAKDFLSLINICSMYTPVSVEILRPNEVKLSVNKAHDILVSASSNWFSIKKFIAERTSNASDLEEYKKYLENRIAVGKKILEKEDK